MYVRCEDLPATSTHFYLHCSRLCGTFCSDNIPVIYLKFDRTSLDVHHKAVTVIYRPVIEKHVWKTDGTQRVM